MGRGDLIQALSPVAVLEDSNPVDVERQAVDMPALQPGAAHACPHPLDDQIALELSDGPDDDDDGPPQRAAGIKILWDGTCNNLLEKPRLIGEAIP